MATFLCTISARWDPALADQPFVFIWRRSWRNSHWQTIMWKMDITAPIFQLTRIFWPSECFPQEYWSGGRLGILRIENIELLGGRAGEPGQSWDCVFCQKFATLSLTSHKLGEGKMERKFREEKLEFSWDTRPLGICYYIQNSDSLASWIHSFHALDVQSFHWHCVDWGVEALRASRVGLKMTAVMSSGELLCSLHWKRYVRRNFGTMSLFCRKAVFYIFSWKHPPWERVPWQLWGIASRTRFSFWTIFIVDFFSDLMLGFHMLSYQMCADHIKSVLGDNIDK